VTSYARGLQEDNTTLLIIIILVIVVAGGGWYGEDAGSRREYVRASKVRPAQFLQPLPGMTIDTRSIAELEKSGFADVDARCAGCGRIVQMPFRMLLERKQVTTAKTIAELHRRCRYRSCSKVQATRRSVAPGSPPQPAGAALRDFIEEFELSNSVRQPEVMLGSAGPSRHSDKSSRRLYRPAVNY
jgi:hypothetical protein